MRRSIRRIVSKWVSTTVAAAMVLSLVGAPAFAQEEKPAGTGTITGTVTKDGAPVPNAEVRLMKVMPRQNRGGGGGAGGAGGAGDGAGAMAQDQAPGEGGAKRPARPEPVAKATTDAEGKFTMSNVPAGDYSVVCAVRGQGTGRATVKLAAGETKDVKVELKQRPAGGGGAGGGDGAGRGGAGGGGAR